MRELRRLGNRWMLATCIGLAPCASGCGTAGDTPSQAGTSRDGGHGGIAASEGGSSSDGATGEADGAFLEVELDAGAPPCADAGSLFVEVTGDGPPQTYVAGCELAMVPYGGHVYSGGEGDSMGESLIGGCAVAHSLNSNLPAPSSISVTSSLAAAGDTDAAAIAYNDARGRAWLGSATLHITRWSPVGGTIEGSYAGTTAIASDAGGPLALGGTFRVCHAFDGSPAP
jgi:hypothetical protein